MKQLQAITLILMLAVSHLSLSATTRTPPTSDHFDGKRFFNPTLADQTLPGFLDALRMMREPRADWPSSVVLSAIPRLHEVVSDHKVAVTWVNHATFLIQSKSGTILTDPIWSKRASPVSWAGPARVIAPGVNFDELPRIDVILISHNHYDHLDWDTLQRLNRKFSPRIIAPLGNKSLLQSIGFKQVDELDWWEQVRVGPELVITLAPAQHMSARSLFDRQKTLWGSYMVKTGNGRIYFGGDSGYSAHFTQIRQRLGAPDLALLGIGAYEPRWFMSRMHMNPAEAVKAHQDLAAKHSIGMHFGTFRLSQEGIDQPVIDLNAALAQANIPSECFTTFKEGETRTYPLSTTAITSPE